MSSRRQFVRASALTSTGAILGTAGCLESLGGSDEDYPSESITTIVPADPGGSTDIFTRQIMPVVADELGVDVQIENVAGAQNLRGTGEVYRADPDGYTQVGLNPPFEMIAALVQDPDFDMQEMEAVGLYTQISWVLIANEDQGIEEYDHLIDEYEAGNLTNIGSVGTGTQGHIINEVIRSEHGVEWEELIAYEGSGPASQAVLSGEVPACPVTAPTAETVADDVNILAAFASDGTPVFPDVDSVTDLGYDNMDFVGLQSKGYWMPPDTDEEYISTMTEALETALQSDELQSWSEESGNNVTYAPPEDADATLQDAFENIPDVIDINDLQ